MRKHETRAVAKRPVKPFNENLIVSKGPITTMKPLSGGDVRGAGLIAFDHRKLLERDYATLSMGLKPSGELHMGTVATILNAMLYLEKHKGSRLKIDIMDQDYDLQRGESFWSFRKMPDANGCHSLMRNHTLDKVRSMVEKLSGILGIDSKRVDVSMFTDNYVCEGFSDLMKSLIRERERSRLVKSAIFDSSGNPYRVPFTPICPECGHSSTKNARYNSKRDDLTAKCKNEDCVKYNEEFSVPVSNILNYNVYFLVDPIRDVHESSYCVNADLHLFGGDYLWIHGVEKKSRVQRVADVMTVVSDSLPDFFVGPLLTLNQLKMSKSLGAEPVDETVADHIYTRFAEMLRENREPMIEIWDVVVG